MTAKSTVHVGEPHRDSLAGRLNWLRAGVLGANDGIVSVAAIVVGVAGATSSIAPIVTAGIAGLVGGAISMALGEYVSVSSQRDSERALIAKERTELRELPEEELKELAGFYEAKGLSAETATQVALELTAHDALAAHLEVELHIDERDIASPWRAALASAVAFLSGAILPMAAVLIAPMHARLPAIVITVLIALVATGVTSSTIGHSPVVRPTARIVIGGALALIATYGIGSLLGTTGIG